MRSPKDVQKEEYNEFYKKTFNEFLDPLAHTHFTTEVVMWLNSYTIFSCQFSSLSNKYAQGEVEFRSVLYVPGMGPLNNEDVMSQKTKNIRLYVKRVFISDDFDGELVSFAIHYVIIVSFFYHIDVHVIYHVQEWELFSCERNLENMKK